ncbi:MAG: hypothetical protein WC855_02740 [Thermodesulfovibrionales bacterium]
MGKLIVELPDEVHRELKKKATNNHKTIKDIITVLVDEYLHAAKQRKETLSKTGLCGSWDDGRSADEIIKDIKAHRRWFTRQRN